MYVVMVNGYRPMDDVKENLGFPRRQREAGEKDWWKTT